MSLAILSVDFVLFCELSFLEINTLVFGRCDHVGPRAGLLDNGDLLSDTTLFVA